MAAKNPQAQQLTSLEKLPTLNHQSRFFRAAVRLALLDLGLLTMNPRSITPPFKPKKTGQDFLAVTIEAQNEYFRKIYPDNILNADDC